MSLRLSSTAEAHSKTQAKGNRIEPMIIVSMRSVGENNNQ